MNEEHLVSCKLEQYDYLEVIVPWGFIQRYTCYADSGAEIEGSLIFLLLGEKWIFATGSALVIVAIL